MNVEALQGYRRSTVTASGPVSYLDVGQGRPAIFIHGLIANSLLWRHVISAVASDQRRCIAIDLPGHGHTPPADVNADVSLTGLARRVIELCDHLDLDRFDLVANDTGGAVAQIVAAYVGDRLSTFTLTDCDTEGNTPPTLFRPITIAAQLGLITRVGPYLAARRHLMHRVLGIGYQHPRRLPDQVVDAYATPVLGTADSARALSRIITALSSADLTCRAPTTRYPYRAHLDRLGHRGPSLSHQMGTPPSSDHPLDHRRASPRRCAHALPRRTRAPLHPLPPPALGFIRRPRSRTPGAVAAQHHRRIRDRN